MDQQLQRRVDQPVTTITQGFGTQEVAMRGERSSDAVAARETAAVQARFVVAIQRPRDVMDFRARLLRECQRPGFADVAMFRKPVGGGQFAEGPSIRMIETCLQLYRNVQATSVTVYDGPDLRIVKVGVIDFEANLSWDQEINIPKTTEKKGYEGKPPKGREVLGQRINSTGDTTYLVVATDDEVTLKQAAMVSKAVRTCGQRLLPRDIIEEAIAQIRATSLDRAKKDPDGEKKALLDAFAKLSVLPSDIAALIGHSVDRMTPAEIAGLRDTYRTIKSGEATWEEIMSAANTTPEPALQEETKARLIAEAEAKKAAQKPPATAEPKTVTVTPLVAAAQPQATATTAEQSDAAEPPVDDLGASRYETPNTNRKGFKL